MMSTLADFHFLRPFWLLALLPLFAITLWLRRRQNDSSGWQRAIDTTLLPYLVSAVPMQKHKRLWPLLFVAWTLSVIAIAGPSWKKLPQPVMQQQDALVIVLDLTLSMLATDESPSRLVHAQRKLTDLLKQRKEGLTALVAYSGDAHTVAPLTDDTATIESMVSALAPDLMPMFGSNAASGVARAVELLHHAGIKKGRILLMTDEVLPQDAQQITSLLQQSQLDLSLLIMGIGTTDGAPIAKSDGGFLKRNDGSIIIARLNADDLAALAASANGRYIDSRVDESDISYLLDGWQLDKDATPTEREFDLWADEGHYLVWLLLPFALAGFRRGALLALFLLLNLPQPSYALEWNDLWQRPDQQAAKALQQNNYEAAAKKFDDPAWRAAAQYRAGKFDDAANTLQSLDNADANYNRGNALAQAGKLEQAIAAYDKVLQQDPANEDAKVNRQLTRDALEQQKKQQQQGDDNEQKNNEKKDGDNQSEENQSGDGKNSEQQQGDQQNQSGQQQPDSAQNSPQDTGQQSAQDQQSSQEQQQPAQNADQQADKSQKDSSQAASQEQQPADEKDASPASEQQAREHNEQQQQAAQQATGDDKKAEEQALQQAIARQQQNRDAAGQPAEQPTQASIAELQAPQTEQQQALEQWLRRVPDDPGGLMRNKFNYQYRLNQREGKHIQEQEQVW